MISLLLLSIKFISLIVSGQNLSFFCFPFQKMCALLPFSLVRFLSHLCQVSQNSFFLSLSQNKISTKYPNS